MNEEEPHGGKRQRYAAGNAREQLLKRSVGDKLLDMPAADSNHS